MSIARHESHGTGVLGDPDGWGWVPELAAETLKSAGEISLELLLRSRHWVNRRVETIELIDESRVRQSVSVDFRLPEKLPGGICVGGQEYFLLPLLVLPRRTDLAYFDIRDEAGSSLPMLSRHENGRLTGLMLLTAAQRAVGEREGERLLPASLRTYLAGLPMRPLGRARVMVEEIVAGEPALFEDSELAPQLLSNEVFCDLLGICQYASAIHLPLRLAPGERHIVKVSWEGRWGPWPGDGKSGIIARLRRGTHWFERAVGWRAKIGILDTPLVGGAESHHIQIALPAGVELTEAGCLNGPPRVMLPDAPSLSDPRRDPYQPFSATISARAHLYVPRAHEQRAGLLQVGLRSAREGLLPAAAMTGALVTLLLGVYSVRADQIVGQSETGAAILLLVPAILAGFLVRPGEHAMARELLRGPRVMTTVLGLLPLIAAGTLVTDPAQEGGFLSKLFHSSPAAAPELLTWVWGGLAILALILTACLVASLVLPRPGKRPTATAKLSPAPAAPEDGETSGAKS